MERANATQFIHELLDLLVRQKGSDLFITAGFPPAMKVDATAPSPGSNTPSFPVAGEIWRGSGIRPSCRISPQYTNGGPGGHDVEPRYLGAPYEGFREFLVA